MKKVPPFLLPYAMLFLASVCWSDTPQPQTFMLTSQENGVEPETSFSCSSTIHGYLTLPHPQTGLHHLDGIWIGPHGTVVRHSHDDLNFATPARTASIWLQFSKEGGSFWNPLSLQSADDEARLRFDGPWKVEVRWDDRVVAQSAFQVHCNKENVL